MGGSSSKNDDKSPGQAARIPKRNSAEARAAWENNDYNNSSGYSNGSSSSSNNLKKSLAQRRLARKNNQNHDDTLNRTTYNLFDLHNDMKAERDEVNNSFKFAHSAPASANGDMSRYNDFDNVKEAEKFSKFRDITNQRDHPAEKKQKSKRSPRKENYSKHRRESPVRNKKSIQDSPKKRSLRRPRSPERRMSDVSTISMNESPRHFKNVREPPRFSKSLNSGPPVKKENNHNRYRRSKSISPPPLRRTPPKAKNRKSGPPHPAIRKRTNTLDSFNGKKSNSFTNIAGVKSATNSFDSNVSNFEFRTRIEKFNDKSCSLRENKLHKLTSLSNQILDQKIQGQMSYDKAKQDLNSDDWEKEIKGIEMIVTMARNRPEYLRVDLKQVILMMMAELKNLRSQVCRMAGQAFAELYLNLGKIMEMELEKVVTLLLQKSADTNKFIREASDEALDAMVENVTVYKAMQAVSLGHAHKSVVVRTNIARLFDKVVTQLGSERLVGSSKDLQELVIKLGSKMLTDSNQEVRKHAKHMFRELKSHKKFDSLMQQMLKENERRDIKKMISSLN